MRVVAHLTDVMAHVQESRVLEMPDDATVADVQRELDLPVPFGVVALGRYYAVVDPSVFYGWRVPYLLTPDGLCWDVPYAEARVADFFATHRIEDGAIHIEHGFPQAGGPGFDAFTLWERFPEALEALRTGAAAAGVAGSGWKLYRWWKGRVPPRGLEGASPGSVLSLIASRPQWNSAELAERAGIEREDAKRLLQTSAYRWDRRRQMYVRTEATDEALRRLGHAYVRVSPPDPPSARPQSSDNP